VELLKIVGIEALVALLLAGLVSWLCRARPEPETTFDVDAVLQLIHKGLKVTNRVAPDGGSYLVKAEMEVADGRATLTYYLEKDVERVSVRRVGVSGPCLRIGLIQDRPARSDWATYFGMPCAGWWERRVRKIIPLVRAAAGAEHLLTPST